MGHLPARDQGRGRYRARRRADEQPPVRGRLRAGPRGERSHHERGGGDSPAPRRARMDRRERVEQPRGLRVPLRLRRRGGRPLRLPEGESRAGRPAAPASPGRRREGGRDDRAGAADAAAVKAFWSREQHDCVD